jgi:intracellular sulfur oxidation DsrE/DsrF family protein
MSGSEKLSDEILNAFVDNELDKVERERIFECLRHDPLLAQRLCQLTHMKELVRAARPEMDESTLAIHKHSRNRHIWGYAAMLFVAVAISSLVYFSDFLPFRQNPANDAMHVIVQQHTNAAEIKVVMQITSDETALMNKLLNQAETLVQMSTQLEKPVRVEIVAYGKGLSMLRSDQSPYAHRISSLRQQHDNLLFVACQETMDKQQRKGVQYIRLLPGVVIVHSGAREVQLRRSQGWAVLKT